ncbi:hypothetical protein C8263_14690 [Deinococcus arcticus]|uniref:Uncharacterized protein n=1 Tax=Deinococcus arcticus TaxID=2136176 RepID=A0A2T3W513_9DEIO|nr:hypothetical protein C8263_14690 [Deinococcus arcticus]
MGRRGAGSGAGAPPGGPGGRLRALQGDLPGTLRRGAASGSPPFTPPAFLAPHPVSGGWPHDPHSAFPLPASGWPPPTRFSAARAPARRTAAHPPAG